MNKEELEAGFNLMVSAALEEGQKRITEYMKRKGISDETIKKAKAAADSLVKDLLKEEEG